MRNKLNKENFSYRSLVDIDMSDSEYVECDFSYSTLSGANFSNCVMYGSSFIGAKLNGIILSMNCLTFRKLQLDDKQVEYFFYLLSLADISADKRRLIDIIISPERRGRLDVLFGQD